MTTLTSHNRTIPEQRRAQRRRGLGALAVAVRPPRAARVRDRPAPDQRTAAGPRRSSSKLFLALWNHAERFDPKRGPLTAWLTVVAQATPSIDRHRRNARADATLSMAALVDPRPDESDALGIGPWLEPADRGRRGRGDTA